MSKRLDQLMAAQEKATQKRHDAQQEEKRLKKQISDLKGKERTHRLCTRGGYLEKLLQEPERLQKLGEFIYNSPEVLHTYIIPKESVDNGNFRVCCGWSVKEEHMDKYGMTENSYTQIFKGKPSVMGISEVPADIGRLANENPEYLKELMIGKHLDYMKEHNLYLNGDIIGIVITKVRDSGKNVIYMLMSLPFGKNDV